MSDGFTLTAEKHNIDTSCFDWVRTFYQFDGFVQALKYVGIDPHIFDNDNTSS